MKTIISLILLLLVLCFPSYGANTDLEWQKIELEKMIDQHYARALAKLLKNNEYHVKSKVSYSDPGMPKFADLNKTGVKVSDIAFDDSKGDYIAFSKVGLEVPVIENYFQENQQKLKELYRFGESYSLFKNLESIDLKIVLSDALKKPYIEAAKKVVEANHLDIADITIKATYKIENISVIAASVDPLANANPDAPKKEEKLSLEKILELVGRFGNAIGMIFASIILGALAFVLLKKYMSMLKEIGQRQESAPAPAAQDNEPQTMMASGMPSSEDGASDGEESASQTGGFEKVYGFFETNKDIAKLVLKRWISEDSEAYHKVLCAFAQQLDHGPLKELQLELAQEERDRWLSFIDNYLTKEELNEANKLMHRDIIREVVAGQAIEDVELIDLVLNLELESAVELIRDNVEDGGILLNILTPSFSSRILGLMNNDEVLRVIEAGAKIGIPDDEQRLEEFKKTVSKYSGKNVSAKFDTRIMQILPDVTPEKEQILYDYLAKSSGISTVLESAKKMLPAELIPNLPDHIMKFLMQNYPLDKKIEILVSNSDDFSENLMDKFAPTGTNAREMLEMELENARMDELAMARLKKNREEIWKEFVQYTRKALLSEQTYHAEISNIVDEWGEGKKIHAS